MVSGFAGHYPDMPILGFGSERLLSPYQSAGLGCIETARTESVPELTERRAGEALEHAARRGR
jgi:hypothetical protein